VRQSLNANQQKSKSVIRVANKKTQILIVEDDQMMSGLIYTAFINNGYQKVYRASTAKEGQQLFKKHKIDVILLDINLPDGNGLTVAEKLKEKHDDLIIIMVSAQVEVPIVEKVMSLKLNGLVTKPLSPVQLLKVFESAVAKHEKKKSQ